MKKGIFYALAAMKRTAVKNMLHTNIFSKAFAFCRFLRVFVYERKFLKSSCNFIFVFVPYIRAKK